MEQFLSTIIALPWWGYLLVLALLVIIRDIFFNPRHTITRNFPLVGHFRYLLESIGPELRQYIVANNRDELPFNRSQRTWIYASSKGENNYQGFGSDQDMNSPGYVFINPQLFPYRMPDNHPNKLDSSLCPSAKVIGLYNKRAKPFRPYSIFNISAMSFGSLSSNAVEALNKGAIEAGCYHNTGEGGLSPYHSFGADVIFHFGTGYFGVRNPDASFSIDKLCKVITDNAFIKAIEVKLSQGAKPGKGGVLPASKISAEIAAIRGIPQDEDALSPTSHSAFTNVKELLTFIEDIAQKTGLPVGIKSAVGKLEMWEELANEMIRTGTGPDFITVDGGEGGTGAAPPSFANHVSLPFMYGFTEVYKLFKEKGLCDRVVWIASGKLGIPSRAMMAFAMGADIVNVAREAMMSIGCIQSQICHTNRCPSGVATQNKWLKRGLVPDQKSVRLSQFIKTLRKEVLEITNACGYEHPCQVTMKDVFVSMGDNNQTKSLMETFQYDKCSVEFSDMNNLINCPYLGAQNLRSKKQHHD